MTRVIWLEGLAGYAAVHALQERLVAEVAAGGPDVILLLEHAETITVGRGRGAAENVLVAGEVPVVSVERGGDVTWHGPGQLVAYPIVRLEGERRDLRGHLRRLEAAVIALLTPLGLAAAPDPRNAGVWLPVSGEPPRKVCSVGVAVRQWVTWHGLALNVSPSLEGFARIRPCGFGSEVMTRLQDHLDPCPTVPGLASPLAHRLAEALELAWDGTIDSMGLPLDPPPSAMA